VICGRPCRNIPSLTCQLEAGHTGYHQQGGAMWSDFNRPAERPPAEQEVVGMAKNEGKLDPEAEEAEEPVQVALFEGQPVHRLQIALGGAGAMIAEDKELHLDDEILVTVRAKVVKVNVHKGAKITTRKATARVIEDPEIDLV
jgi:hypothetical protein